MPTPYAIVIEKLSKKGDRTELNKLLLKTSRFKGQSAKLKRIDTMMPVALVGLTEKLAGAIEAELVTLVSLYSLGLEKDILQGPLAKLRSTNDTVDDDEPEEDTLDTGDSEDDDIPKPAGSSMFESFDLSEGEVELPGDPDDEEDSDYIEFSAEEVKDSGTSAKPDISAELEVEEVPQYTSGRRSASDSMGDQDMDGPTNDGAAGMSMELEVPNFASKRDAKTSTSTSKRSRGSSKSSRKSRLRVVVTNLPYLQGFRSEPVGMVTHHFCRSGGGEGREARKRVRAFGDRYRKALKNLARQAREVGADTVLGVEVILQPTGGDDTVWVLLQGTAVRRIPE